MDQRCGTCQKEPDATDIPVMFVLLRVPDVCDGNVNATHIAKHAACKNVSPFTAACKPACFQLKPQELNGEVPIPTPVLLLLLALAAENNNHTLIHAVLLISQHAKTTVYVHKHLHGSSLTFRLELALFSLVLCHKLGDGIWNNTSIKKHVALPFTRFGVPLTVDLLKKAYSKDAELLTQSLLEHVEAQSLETKHAVQAYLVSKDENAYVVASKAAPFAFPPIRYIDKTINVAQPKLKVTLKHHQQHVVSWALWREKEGFIGDVIGVTWERKHGLDNVFSRSPACKKQDVVSRTEEPWNQRGGMLLDEMGLGKTIEMLAVIACDKPVHERESKETATLKPREVLVPVRPGFPAPFETPGNLRMSYSKHNPILSLVVHSSEDIVSSRGEVHGGTLIVAPSSLCSQWVDEITSKFHTPGDYPVVKHYGSSRHDDVWRLHRSHTAVVVTTYETLLADLRHVRKSQQHFIHSCEWSCNRNLFINVLKTPVSFNSAKAKPYDVIRQRLLDGSDKHFVVTIMQDFAPHVRYIELNYDRFNTIKTVSFESRIQFTSHSTAEYIGDLIACTSRNKGAYQCAQCGFEPTSALEKLAEQVHGPLLSCIAWKRVVCDESHRLKPNLECLRLLQMLPTKRRWCLTGTPFPTSDEDKLTGQLIFLHASIENKLHDQKHLLADIMVRHTKATVSDVKVGAISHLVLKVNMNAKERKSYDDLANCTQEFMNTLTSQDTVTSSTREVMAMLYKQRLACTVCSQDKFQKATNTQPKSSFKILASTVKVDCPVCWETACPGFMPFECTHGVCYFCVQTLLEAGINKCPICRNLISGIQAKDALKHAKAGLAATAAAITETDDESKVEVQEEEDESVAMLDENVWGDSKTKVLLEYLSRRDVPTVVFTQFNECVDMLAIVLRKHGYNVCIVRGSMTEGMRGRTIARFKTCNTKAVLLLTLRSASFGLNLTHASRLVHMDVALQEVQEKQANGRVHRQGQEHDVEVCHLVCAGTVEENIAEYRNAATMDVGENTILSSDGVVFIVESDKLKRQRELQLLGLVGNSTKKPRRES